MPNNLPKPGDILNKSSLPKPSDVLEPVKKKEATPVPKKKGVIFSPVTDLLASTSATSKQKTAQKPLVSSGGNIDDSKYYKFPGQEDATYKKSNNKWYVDTNSTGKYQPLTKGDVGARVKNLEQNAVFDEDITYSKNKSIGKILGATEGDQNNKALLRGEVFTGFPGKEQNKYRIIDDKWQYSIPKGSGYSNWADVTNDNSIKALSTQFNKLGKLDVSKNIDYISDFKAKNLLGDNATEQQLADKKEYFNNIEKQKILRSSGFDVPLNGDLKDPQTVAAFKLFDAKMESKSASNNKNTQLNDKIDSVINANLITNDEEAVVSKLRKEFGADGFIFDETGIGDAITVSYSIDGVQETEPITIDLQTFRGGAPEMLKLRSYMKTKHVGDYERKLIGADTDGEAAVGTDDKVKHYSDLVSLMAKNPAKYGTELVQSGEIDNITEQGYRDIKEKYTVLGEDSKKLEEKINQYNLNPTKELELSINNDANRLKQREYQLKREVGVIQSIESNYSKAVGAYASKKEKDGSFIGGLTASFGKGIASIPKTLLNVATDVMPLTLKNNGLSDQQYEQYKQDGLTDSDIANKTSSMLKRTVVEDVEKGIINIASLGGTAKEYLGSEDRGIVSQAVNALAESIGANISGGGNPMLQKLAFFSQSYNNMESQMSGAEFDDMNALEKKGISVLYGIGIGQLEKLGFDVSTGIGTNPLIQKFINYTVGNTLKSLPKNASIHLIEEAISKNIKASIASNSIKVLAGGVAEATPEFVQSIGEVGLKNVVNAMHGKEYFQDVPDLTTADGIKEALSLASYDALVGGIGGSIMGSYSTYKSNRNTSTADKDFELMNASLTDPVLLKAVKKNTVERLRSGAINKEQAKAEYADIDKSVGILNTIPTNLSNREKRASYELLLEKNKLEKEIEGKDENLVAKQKARVAEINNELTKISEDATKENNIQEVTTEGGTVEYQRTGEGQQEVGVSEGSQRETTQPGTDRGDSTVASEVQQEEVGPILSGTINVSDDKGRKGLVPISELDNFIGEDRTGEAETAQSRERIDKLKEDISKNGFKEPIILIYDKFSNGGEASIIEGNHRIIAAKELGFKEIPVTFEKGTIRTNEARVSEGMFPLNRKVVGKLNDTYGVKGSDLGLTVRQPTDTDYILKEEATPNIKQDQVATLRAEEQAELADVIPNIEDYKVDGEVDKTLMTPEDLVKYNEVYDKYDKLITPLLNATKEGPTVEQEVEAIGQLLSGTDAQIDQKATKIVNKKIAKTVSRAAKAVSKIIPGTKFIVHDTDESYRAATKEEGLKQSSNGEFNAKTNTIHINGTSANNRTVAHEVFHAILINKVKTDKNAADVTKRMIESIWLKVDVDINKKLNDFISNYDENIQNEEKLAELVGILSENYNSFSTSVKDTIFRWIDKLAKIFKLDPFDRNETYDMLKTIARKVAKGKEISEADIEILGGDSEVGTFNIPDARKQNVVKKSPSVANDTRDFIKEFVQDIDIREFNGSKFVTNMYDYTNAGITDLGNGFTINLLGGKNYVPLMMSINNKKIGDVSNLAAFNTKAQAETFIRNVEKSGSNLFAPHSGTKSQSWQFQQHTFAELVNLVLDKNILTNRELIDTFNNTIQNNAALKNKFNTFKKRYGKDINNFDTFESNPKEIVNLLDIENNLSPDIRKALNNSIASNKKFQAAIGVNNKAEFYDRIMDPLNKGIEGGEIMSVVKFDPTTFEIVKTLPSKEDHHPSFGWTVMAKIEAVYQPTEFHMSAYVTDTYTKHNLSGEEVSRKSEEPGFEQKNVASSAGAIPKVAEFNIEEEVTAIEDDISNRKQKPKAINDIVKLTKDQGFSDAAIRQYLKEQGYTDKQATAAINEYNVKKEGIFVKRDGGVPTRIADSIKSFKRRMFSARAFLPKSVFTAREDKEANVARHLNIVDQNVKDFNRLYSKYKGDKDALVDNFDKYIRGDKDAVLPDEFLVVANSMRNQIDGLSQQLINSGIVDADMAKTIKDNMGQYLTRSYKIYDRANWKKEVQDEVKQKAINLLKSQYRDMAQQISDAEGIPLDEALDNLVTNRLDEMLTTDGASNFITGSKLGAKDLSVFKERQDIPIEIRMLLGEYSDPALNYAKTVLKLSSLAANHKFLTEIKKNGTGVYFYEKNDPRRPADFNTMIATEGSDTMNPLNGLYTTKEIADSFMAQPSQLSDFWKTFMKFQSSIRWLKTIGSVATHIKNVFGNIGFVWINGHFDPKEVGRAFMTVKNDFSKGTNQQRRDKMNNYISLGIVKQSAGLGEIMDMFKDANWDTAMASRLSNEKIGLIGKAKRLFFQGKKKIEDAYQAEDDFFKIVAYENELTRYSKAMFNKEKSELTEDELVEVNKVVTEIVKNTYPTYDRIPEAIKMVRRAPFIGNFVSFQAESYRTAFNTVALAKNELTSDNKKIKAIGAQRLAGATTYLSAKSAILAYFSMAAGTGLTGLAGYLFDDDDEEKKDKDIRKFVAPWSEKSDLLMISVGGGKMKYIDFSSSDPHGALKKVMNAFFLGETTIDAFSSGIVETFSPFIGEDMTVEALLALKNNQDKYGNPIYNSEESLKDQSDKVLAYMYKLVEPGTFSSIRRGIASEDKTNELVANLTGFRTYDVDVNQQFGYKIKDYSDRITNAKKIYNSAYYNEKMTDAEKNKAYNKSNESLKKIYLEVTELYDSAERLGCKPEDLGITMKDFGGMSKENITEIQSGKIPQLKKKDEEDKVVKYY